MGLLSALFGRRTNVRRDHDRIWLTTEAKFTELAYDVAHRAAKGPAAILLVGFFEDVQQRLQEIAEKEHPVPIKVVDGHTLNEQLAADSDLGGSSLDIICGERHPSFRIDQQVLDFAEALDCRCNLVCHLSFEDALVRRLADPDIIRMLGVKEGECVQSGMIHRRVRRTQQQVDSKATSASSAQHTTAEEWFAACCPDMKPAKS